MNRFEPKSLRADAPRTTEWRSFHLYSSDGNTLTANIVLEMGYATGLHREALIATAVVLFVFILIINLSVSLLRRGKNAGD